MNKLTISKLLDSYCEVWYHNYFFVLILLRDVNLLVGELSGQI